MRHENPNRIAVLVKLVKRIGCVILLFACGPRGEQSSAGSRGDAFTLGVDSVAVLEIGAINGPAEVTFQRIVDVVVVDGGDIAIADEGCQCIRRFSAAGEFIGTVGGEGSGPGEFRRIAALVPSDGRLHAVDTHGRVTRLDASGSVTGTYRFSPPTPVAILADSILVRILYARSVDPNSLGHTRAILRAELTALNGEVVAEVDHIGAVETVRLVESDRVYQYRVPFGAQPIFASDGDRLYATTGENYAVTVYSAKGTTIGEFKRVVERYPVTEQARSGYRERTLGTYRNAAGEARRYDRLSSEIAWPEFVPVIRALAVDEMGTLWISRIGPDGADSGSWDLWNRTGTFIGTAVLPLQLRPEVIQEDFILGVWQDSLGVEYVRKYRLVRR